MKLAQALGLADHVLGAPEAPVTVVAYLDYECPSCASVQRRILRLLGDTGDLVRYVPRHFPRSPGRPHALQAAQAAEAAAAQGRFWPMHARLLEHPAALDLEDLVAYARALGLDVPRFADELRSGVHLPKVQEDIQCGLRSGVEDAPACFLDGERLDWQRDPSALVAVVRAAAARTAARPEPAAIR